MVGLPASQRKPLPRNDLGRGGPARDDVNPLVVTTYGMCPENQVSTQAVTPLMPTSYDLAIDSLYIIK